MPKRKAPPELNFPRMGVHHWMILGVDLSLTRTGFATLRMDGCEATWAEVGSLVPSDSGNETWARAAAIGLKIREYVQGLTETAEVWTHDHPEDPMAVLVSLEFPDPHNSYLMALNGIIQTLLWCGLPQPGTPIYRLAINANTLRSCLQLRVKGEGASKKVNLAKAFTFIEQSTFPSLDTDACDAVLLATMARYAVLIFLGYEDLVPPSARVALCTSEQRVKVRASRKEGVEPMRIETPRALLLNPATWAQIVIPPEVTLKHFNARSPKPRGTAITLFL